MDLAEQLATRKLVVFLGTGGVGKTTIAAASALEAARLGRRTLVLTIDPAKRLADAMGVKIGSEIATVRPNLDALMLDTKAALDGLVRRYATTPETLSRILASRFYEQLSDAFAGSEEFVAMGALHDLMEDGKYDVIVVDTPPSRHAVEFLRVNSKLIRVYESGVVRYLFRPTRFLRLGGGYMAQMLGKWTSSEYVNEFAEFMTTFDQMFQDMEARVRTMDRVLGDASATSLNLVSAADEESVAQTVRLHQEIARLGWRTDACIANRAYPELPPYAVEPRRFGEIARGAGLDANARERFVADAEHATAFYATIAADHARYAALLRESVPAHHRTVPAMPGSVHDMAGLERIRAALFDGS